MNDLLDFLARFGELTDEELVELTGLLNDEQLAEQLTGFSDEDLAQLGDVLPTVFDAAREGDTADLEFLTGIVDTLELVRAEDAARETAAQEFADTVAGLADRVHASDEADPVEDETDETDIAEALDELDNEHQNEAEREPVLAGANPPAKRPVPLGRIRRPKNNAPAAEDSGPFRTISLMSNLPTPAGGGAVTVKDLVDVLSDQARKMRNVSGEFFTPIARFTTSFPEDRMLSRTDTARNTDLITRVYESAEKGLLSIGVAQAYESLVAAGGNCTPLPVRYTQDVLGTTNRPVLGALASFGAAERGGYTWVPSPTLDDIGVAAGPGETDAGLSIWTKEDDAAADLDEPGTFKSIQEFSCPDPVDTYLYQIVGRFRFSNINAMTFPERTAALLYRASVAHARLAESALLASIKSQSDQVTGWSTILGTARDLVAEFAAAAYALRDREREEDTTVVRVIAPNAARVSALIDLTRQLPGDNAAGQAARIFNAMLAEHNIAVTWTKDLIIPGQVSTALPAVPSSIEYGVFFEGTFASLDGLTLDLGFGSSADSNDVIRDSRLNAVNKYEIMMESGEAVAKFGPGQALWVSTEICPSGATSGTEDVFCGTGS